MGGNEFLWGISLPMLHLRTEQTKKIMQCNNPTMFCPVFHWKEYFAYFIYLIIVRIKVASIGINANWPSSHMDMCWR